MDFSPKKRVPYKRNWVNITWLKTILQYGSDIWPFVLSIENWPYNQADPISEHYYNTRPQLGTKENWRSNQFDHISDPYCTILVWKWWNLSTQLPRGRNTLEEMEQKKKWEQRAECTSFSQRLHSQIAREGRLSRGKRFQGLSDVSPIKCDVRECVVKTSDSLTNMTF